MSTLVLFDYIVLSGSCYGIRWDVDDLDDDVTGGWGSNIDQILFCCFVIRYRHKLYFIYKQYLMNLYICIDLQVVDNLILICYNGGFIIKAQGIW